MALHIFIYKTQFKKSCSCSERYSRRKAQNGNNLLLFAKLQVPKNPDINATLRPTGDGFEIFLQGFNWESHRHKLYQVCIGNTLLLTGILEKTRALGSFLLVLGFPVHNEVLITSFLGKSRAPIPDCICCNCSAKPFYKYSFGKQTITRNPTDPHSYLGQNGFMFSYLLILFGTLADIAESSNIFPSPISSPKPYDPSVHPS